MAKKEKQEGIAKAIAAINNHYQQKIVRTASELEPIRKIPTGDISLDYVLGGGMPIGRIVEFLGAEHSGKTRDSYKIIEAFQHYCGNCHTQNSLSCKWDLEENVPVPKKLKCEVCKKPKTAPVVIIDYENTTDIDYLKTYFNVDLNGILIVTAYRPSQVVDIVEEFLGNPETGLILVDSIGAFSSDAEVDRSQAEIKMNEGARFMNTAIRKWQAALNRNYNLSDGKSLTTLLLINRTYETLSLYSAEVPQGGRGLRHAKSITVSRKIKERVKEDGKVIGVIRYLQNLKNKAGFPYRWAEDYLFINEENKETYMKTNVEGQYVQFALRFGIVQMKGGWYAYKDKKWHGRAEFEREIKKTGIIEEVNKIIYGDIKEKEKKSQK